MDQELLARIEAAEAEGLTLRKAADRLGITRQKLSAIWTALYPNPWGIKHYSSQSREAARETALSKPHSLLRRIRLLADCTSQEAAERLPCSHVTLRSWESGQSKAGLLGVADALAIHGWRLEAVSPDGERASSASSRAHTQARHAIRSDGGGGGEYPLSGSRSSEMMARASATRLSSAPCRSAILGPLWLCLR